MLYDVCNSIFYWAMEDGHTINAGLFESNQLSTAESNRISKDSQQRTNSRKW